MNVIWKRPDGYHGAKPSDYVVLDLPSLASKIWLHRTDKENFPFRISGGWQEELASKRLNGLVHLLDKPETAWRAFLHAQFEHSKFEDLSSFMEDLLSWLKELQGYLKGDTWEIAIMKDTLDALVTKIQSNKGLLS